MFESGSVVYPLRIDGQTYQQLRRIAKREDRTVASLMRHVLHEAMSKRETAVAAPAPTPATSASEQPALGV